MGFNSGFKGLILCNLFAISYIIGIEKRHVKIRDVHLYREGTFARAVLVN